MATVVNFGGKKIIEPGVYAIIKSGIPAAPTTGSFGNVCIIDTGSGAGFGGGSGVNGVLADGVNTVYGFEDINDFQDFVRGGLLWDLATYIFNPASAADGPEQVMVIRAAETTPAEITFAFTGGVGSGAVSALTYADNGAVYATGTYSAVPVPGGAGVGLTVDITVDGGGNITSLVINTAGSGYVPIVGLIIPGTAAGGATPADDITVDITAVTASGGGFVRFITKNEGAGANGYMDETLAKGKIVINAPIVIGDTVDVQVDEGAGAFSISGGVVTALSTSATDLRTAIIDAINGSTAGYTAYDQAGEIIVTARKKSGADANLWPLTTVIVGTVTTTVTSFAGGLDGTIVSTGYAAQMSVGTNDPSKFMIEFYEGTYRGISPGGNHYSGLSPQDSLPNLIATSVEFDNIDDLIQWAKSDYNFAKRFELDLDSWIISGTGTVDSGDLATYADLNLAVNGTTDYAGDDLDKVLSSIKELDNTFFLCDRWGAEAAGTQNTKIWAHIQNGAEFNKFMVVGGGIDETKFEGAVDSSIEVAKYYDSTSVIVVHSGFKRPNTVGSGYERMPAIYHAANVVGRLGGLEPQVPITFKSLIMTDFLHSMTQIEREKALQAGVLHNRVVPGIGSVVNQGINTLQRNTQLINPDGTSFEISVMRIGAQLNKEMVLNLRPLFVGNNVGSASPADVKLFVERYLASRTATDLQDNLILSWKNCTVRLIEDYYDIKYGFVPNGPINKLFVTGFMLDANLSA